MTNYQSKLLTRVRDDVENRVDRLGRRKFILYLIGTTLTSALIYKTSNKISSLLVPVDEVKPSLHEKNLEVAILEDVPKKTEPLENTLFFDAYYTHDKASNSEMYRKTFDKYNTLIEHARSKSDRGFEIVGLMYQSSLLRDAGNNIILPGEKSETSLFGTVKSDKKLNYGSSIHNLLKAYENYERVEKIRKTEDLLDEVGYGLGDLGKVATLGIVHKNMIITIDSIMNTIDSPENSKKLPILKQRAKELISQLSETDKINLVANVQNPYLKSLLNN